MPPDARLTTALAEQYTLVQELGQGGMATVYLAHDRKHDRDVALKVLRPELAAILGRERFLAEIRLTARLDHPHILSLIDSGESDGFLWYTLPYIRGESLRHKLERETQLGVEEAVRITTQVAGALHHAHQHGIIHRDVKPENILLHEGEAMLADFGIALAVKEAGGRRLTETGLSLGTPQYMSPEQATAEKTLDVRSDVYSLGAVLYEMLAGEPPFTGATGQAVIAKLLVEPPGSLRIVRGTIPPGLEAVVLQALSKVPADRFPTAVAFAEALAAPETQRAPWRVPRWALPLGGAAIVALLLATVWLGPKLRLGRTPRQRGEPTLTQVTFSGDAYGPALSPNGKQVAFGAGHDAVILEDLGLGEHRVLANGFSEGIYALSWSPDQRFLLFTARKPDSTQGGLFLLSLFDGRVRLVSREIYGGQFLGDADTIIGTSESNFIGDATASPTRWLHLLSREGRRLDSIPFKVPGGGPWPVPSPDGTRILIWNHSVLDEWRGLHLIDRHGRLTDSLPSLPGVPGQTRPQWTASGDAVLELVPEDSAAADLWTLLRFPVSAAGKVRLPPDTVARGLRLPGLPNTVSAGQAIALSSPSRTGDHAIALRTETFDLSSLERSSLMAPPLRKTKPIQGATRRPRGRISPDGEQILVWRPVTLNGQPATQLELWPFAGGTGTPLGPPRTGVRGMSWSGDGSAIFLLAEAGTRGLLEHSRIEVASGRILRTRSVPDTVEWMWMRDSLLFYRSVGQGRRTTPQEWRSWPDDGENPLVLSFPDSAPWVEASIVGPDGQGSWLGAVITSRHEGDTLFTLHIAHPGMPAKRVMEFTGPWWNLQFVHSTPGPTFEVVADLIGGGFHRLLLEPGRPPRDLGPMPIPMRWPSFSADGRRGVLVESESHSDIWVMRWPGGSAGEDSH